MRLHAVLFLVATLAFSSALCHLTTPTTTMPISGVQAAIDFFKQFKNLQTTPGSPGSNPDHCYTKNQEEGKCVKTSLCQLPAPDIDPKFIYRTATNHECSFLLMCCPNDKIIKNPVPPTDITPSGCGYSNPAIGRFRTLTESGYADFAEFPWMVALLKNPRNIPVWDNTFYIGGGTLIHPSVVITAAHKVDTMAANDLKCRAGEWETENENESYEHQDREVQKIIVHDQFDKLNAYYNVALLKMKTPFLSQPHINVACLSQTMPPPGTLCYSMGWGMDFTKGTYNANVLKKIPMPLMPPFECERRFRKSRLGPRYFLHRSLTCAGGVLNVDTCIGDGGSPLVCPVGDPSDLRYTVVGMVAYGMDCGSEFPNAYAKIPEFYNWVKQCMYREGFYDMPYSI